MPAGFQVFDPNGKSILDTADRITRVLGLVDIAGASGSQSNAGLATGSPFWTIVPNGSGWPPAVTISGNTISWSYGPQTPKQHCSLVYGVY